jgi:hypothetical protein
LENIARNTAEMSRLKLVQLGQDLAPSQPLRKPRARQHVDPQSGRLQPSRTSPRIPAPNHQNASIVSAIITSPVIVQPSHTSPRTPALGDQNHSSVSAIITPPVVGQTRSGPLDLASQTRIRDACANNGISDELIRQLFHESNLRSPTAADLKRQVNTGRLMARRFAMDAFDNPPASLEKKPMLVLALKMATAQLRLSEHRQGQPLRVMSPSEVNRFDREIMLAKSMVLSRPF